MGDDLKIRKSRKPRADVFGQTVGQSFEVRIAARRPERQHGDPEAFTGASRTGIGRRGSVPRRSGSWRGMRCGSRHVPKLIAHITRGLNAVARIFFQAAADHACQTVRQIGAHISDQRRTVAPVSYTHLAKKEELPEMKPQIPRPPVKTNVFSTGSSATPTMAAAPEKVQTGGFGDPNGVTASDPKGHPITIAQAGSFDMPAGPGYGNGTGGAKGARGVVASTGFGSGVATGNGSGISGSRGTVQQGGFGDTNIAAAQPKPKSAEVAARVLPVEITYKPRPVYTDEGRQLKIEGEVLLDVIFSATGQIRIVKVERGLGHGLDESAVRAAEKIQFKPALKDGQPADFEAVLHIVFQLAS